VFLPPLHFKFLNTYVQMVCALPCAPLFFLDRDIKCHGLNWGAQEMLILISSLSVAPDALQVRKDGLGNFAMPSLHHI